MANTGSIGVIKDLETFLTDNVGTASADGLKWINSSDGGTVFVRAASAAKGLTLQGITAATNNHMHELASDTLDVYGQNGNHVLEVLFQFDIITTLAFNIGFNDDQLDDSNTLPVELSTTTFTSNAATFVGFVFDTNATNDEVHAFWVNGDSDTGTAIADLRFKGIAPVAAKWCKARIEMQDRGSGNGTRVTLAFACDGKSAEKVFDTSVSRSTALCPYIGFENRDAIAHTMDIKYIYREMPIAD